MSTPPITKEERERTQARLFLERNRIAYGGLEAGANPPDIVVAREGRERIDVEITEYHPEDDRVGMEQRWNQLRKEIDRLARQRPILKGVSLAIDFRDSKNPQYRDHSEIAEALVECADYVVRQGWVAQDQLKLSFLDWDGEGCLDRIANNWRRLRAKEWPVLAEHVNVLEVSQFQFDGYLPSSNHRSQTAWCSPYGAAFQSILKRKEDRIRRAINDKRYLPSGGQLWLVIVSDTAGDMSSCIFGDEYLKKAIEEAQFDIQASVFDRVWLMNESSGRSHCLYPWNEPVRED